MYNVILDRGYGIAVLTRVPCVGESVYLNSQLYKVLAVTHYNIGKKKKPHPGEIVLHARALVTPVDANEYFKSSEISHNQANTHIAELKKKIEGYFD